MNILIADLAAEEPCPFPMVNEVAGNHAMQVCNKMFCAGREAMRQASDSSKGAGNAQVQIDGLGGGNRLFVIVRCPGAIVIGREFRASVARGCDVRDRQ
ncbi:hypothetical protein [Halomonas salinarum]|uniref:hypothetical protein n=1 Tax=Halomonas salinarum TaxID=1158993 RepID=UPI0014389D4F|nr:hypothetical protein [Halomonas salinarum]